MAQVIKTGANRNCERREEEIVVAELFPATDGTLVLDDEYIVSALPANALLTGVTVVCVGTNAVADVNVKIGATTISVLDVPTTGTVKGTVTEEFFVSPVSISVVIPAGVGQANLTTGKLMVLVKFVEVDVTTGTRVQALV